VKKNNRKLTWSIDRVLVGYRQGEEKYKKTDMEYR
jgi:hypothetical protein